MVALYNFLCANLMEHVSDPYTILDVTGISLFKLGVAKTSDDADCILRSCDGTCATPAIHDALNVLSKKKNNIPCLPFSTLHFSLKEKSSLLMLQ